MATECPIPQARNCHPNSQHEAPMKVASFLPSFLPGLITIRPGRGRGSWTTEAHPEQSSLWDKSPWLRTFVIVPPNPAPQNGTAPRSSTGFLPWHYWSQRAYQMPHSNLLGWHHMDKIGSQLQMPAVSWLSSTPANDTTDGAKVPKVSWDGQWQNPVDMHANVKGEFSVYCLTFPPWNPWMQGSPFGKIWKISLFDKTRKCNFKMKGCIWLHLDIQIVIHCSARACWMGWVCLLKQKGNVQPQLLYMTSCAWLELSWSQYFAMIIWYLIHSIQLRLVMI